MNNNIESSTNNNTSSLVVECKASETKINSSFNVLLDNAFNKDLSVSALGFKVDAYNLKNAEVVVQGKEVMTKLPLQILINRDTFIADINIEGKLELVFITKFDIKSDWELTTLTNLEDYTWLDAPELSLGKININIKALADLIIDKNKGALESLIDDTVAGQLDFKSQVSKLITYIQKPITVEPSKSLFANINISKILLSEVRYFKSDFILFLAASGSLSISDSPSVVDYAMPQFDWLDVSETSHIQSDVKCSVSNLQKIINYNLGSKTFNLKDKEISVSKTVVKSDGKYLILNAEIEGDVSGEVQIIGQPELHTNARALSFKIKDVKYQTDNILHKALTWILKSKIKDALDKALKISFDEEMIRIQTAIDKSLRKANKSNALSLIIKLDKVDISHFAFDEKGISSHLEIQGQMKLELNQSLGLEPNFPLS